MDNVSSFSNSRDYFNYFEEIYSDKQLKKKYPLITNEIEKNCNFMKQAIEIINNKNFFRIHSILMGLDLRLQILLDLLEIVEDDSGVLSEQEIVGIAENDYQNYFKEMCSYNYNQQMPHSLYFSVA